MAVETTSAVATWTSQQGHDYRVELADRPDFADAENLSSGRGRVGIEALTPGSTYFLRVRAVDEEDGPTSLPSRVVSFTTAFEEEPPRLALGSTGPTRISARAEPARKDGGHEFQLGADASFSSPTILMGERRAVFEGLDVDTRYVVRARSVDERGRPTSDWSKTASRSPARIAPLGVASFNVRKSTQANWGARRTAVARTILDSGVAVVGLQEATPISVRPGVRQYQDVRNLLGPNWALTEAGTGATGEARTVYDRTKLTLVDHGYEEVRGSTRFGVMRYITWAIFEQRVTGKRFVFTNTHFVYQKSRSAYAHREAATQQLVAMLRRVNPERLPVVAVGDFNSGDYRQASNGVYRVLTEAGLVDPLVRSGRTGAAEELVNADLKTVHGGARRPPRSSRFPMVDGIFVTPMRVAQWETVARLDEAGRFIGTVPSDHHMIKATVYLP